MSILGGRVETLYEEWEMCQTYAGFSRSSLGPSQSSDSSGPPPFEKLQLCLRTDKQRFYDTAKLNLKPENPFQDKMTSEKAQATQRATPTIGAKTENKPSASNFRPKEVTNVVPLQNQKAAHKLLQKMNQPNVDGRHARGPKYRGKGNYNEPEVFTLDEWEKRKVGAKPTLTDPSHDEELTWQLQPQLDLEDRHVETGPRPESGQIRVNMFNFGGVDDSRSHGRNKFRGRGRGRGRGRRRYG